MTKSEEKLKCGKCTFAADNESQLETHVRTVHEMLLRTMCAECGRGFKNTIHLSVHKRVPQEPR